MEYISASKAAKKGEISEKRVQNLNVSIEEIVEKYNTYIFNIAYKLTGKTEQAEDIAQETFIKAWKHLDELKDQAALKQWLRTICINEFRMSLRKDTRQKTTYVDNIEELEKDGELLVNPPENVIEEVQASEDVISMRNGCFLAMSRKLSVNQRIAPKAVKGLLYRARMNLDSFFQNHCYFLNTENPCRCKAWVDFFQTRDELQSFMKDKILDYTEKGYEFDLEVRKKIALYYHQIPDQMPRKEWYQMVISQFKNI